MNKKKEIRYVTLAYGKREAWGAPLAAWLDHTLNVIEKPVTIVSDGQLWIDDIALSYSCPVLRCPFVYHNKALSNLNWSGMLLAEAALYLSPCLVVTLDCELLQPVKPEFWMNSFIALGQDNFVTEPRKWNFNGHTINELSCAIQWCGHSIIGDVFYKLWNIHLKHPKAQITEFWEQIIWSLVWDHFRQTGQAELYPLEMNWSCTVPNSSDKLIIKHYHGRRKKELFRKWGVA